MIGKRKEQTVTYLYKGEEGRVGERETNRVTGTGLGTASSLLHHTDVAFTIQARMDAVDLPRPCSPPRGAPGRPP